MIIRASSLADIAAATAIYAHHVRTGAASFELAPPDQAEMTRRRAALVDKGLPWLVAEGAGGAVLGYAYASTKLLFAKEHLSHIRISRDKTGPSIPPKHSSAP